MKADVVRRFLPLGLVLLASCEALLGLGDKELGPGGGGDAAGGIGASTGGSAATGGGGVGGAVGGGGAGGAGGAGGGAGAPICGTVELLAGTFAGGIDPNVWTTWDGGGLEADITAAAGAVSIALEPSVVTAGQDGLKTSRYYDLRSKRLYVQVPAMVDTGTTAEADLTLSYNVDYYVRIQQQGGEIRYTANSEVVQWETLDHRPYSPEDDRWWSIRQAGAQIIFETSADGITWQHPVGAWVENLFPVDYLQVSLNAANPDGVAAPGAVTFAALNGADTPEPWCPAGSLQDGFDDFEGMWSPPAAQPWPSPVWRRGFADTDCTISEADGKLTFASGGQYWSCQMRSSRAFDLTGSSVTLSLPTLHASYLQDNDLEVVLELSMEPAEVTTFGNLLSIGLAQGYLKARYVDDGVPYDANPSAPPLESDPTWLRIEEGGGQVRWLTSGNGNDWTQLAQRALPFDVNALEVVLRVLSSNDSDPPPITSVSIDSVNVPP